MPISSEDMVRGAVADSRRFPGYGTAAGCLIVMFCNLGVGSTFGVFLPSIAKAIGQDVTICSYCTTVTTATAFLASMALPTIVRRLGAKNTLFVSEVFLALYCFTFSSVSNLWMLMFAGFFEGIFLALGTMATNAIIIGSWFIEKRSTVTGVVFGGAAFGAAVFQLIGGWICELHGFRIGYLSLLVIGVTVTVITNVALIRNPAKVGAKPLGWRETGGDGPTGTVSSDHAAVASEVLPGVPFGKAVRSLPFWLALLAILFCGPLITGLQTYAPAYWGIHGMNGGVASSWMAVWSAVGCIATILLGFVAEHWGNVSLIVITEVCYIIGVFFMVVWAGNLSAFFIVAGVVFLGISYPLTTSVPATLCTETFGLKDYNRIVSWFTGALYLGKAVSPLLMKATIDATGSYQDAFAMLGALAVTSLLLVLAALVTSPYRRRKRARS